MRWKLILLVAVPVVGAVLLAGAFDRWVDRTELPVLVSEVSREVRASDGTLLRAYTVADGRWRLNTSIADVDPAYLEMLIAYEDKRFYSHNGVDLIALTRALGQALWNGRVVSGGSTLTMQVARLLENSGTGAWRGKIRQIRVALALERQLTKEQILTLYLNHAPFGGNIEGVRAATRAWFGKPAHRLTPDEAALLIALPQSPEARRPDRAPDAAFIARNRVLDRMFGAGVLSAEAVSAARHSPVPTARAEFPLHAAHLADRVVGADPVVRVHQLTLDTDLQLALEELAATAVQGRSDDLNIAIVVADHTTGQVLAHIGSAAYSDESAGGFVDLTRAVRSPGSTLKPLVYGLAFDLSLAHPETLIDDRPTAFGTYAPQNFDGVFRGTLRVREALQLSLNIPVIQLTEAMGPAVLMTGLRQAGVEPVLPGGSPGLAVALGGVGVTLEDLVALYASFPNGGRAVELSVTGRGAQGAQVMGATAAWHVGNILSGINPPAGATRLGLAYKTGTSYGYRDAWAVGFDGRYVAGVWMGRADGTPVPGAFGGELAAPILFDVFARLGPRLVPLGPPPPDVLLVATEDLPRPLRHFTSRDAVFVEAGAPEVAFPPDGAVLARQDWLVVKVRDGVAPFTWLINGAPVEVSTYDRETEILVNGPGFLNLTVIDAEGRSARSAVMVE